MGAVTIDPRFNGPPESANGGYAAGALAAFVSGGGAVEVTLRLPPPLGVELAVVGGEGEGVELRDGEAVVASARAAELELEVPQLPSLATAAASKLTPDEMRPTHPFPTCFACGPDRDPADSVRLIVGPVAGRDGLFATDWTPPEALAGDDGALPTEVVWAALDCPTAGAAVPLREEGSPPHVLGRLTAKLLAPVRVGAPHVVASWRLGHEGRKRYGACAIATAEGELLAVSHATWIALKVS